MRLQDYDITNQFNATVVATERLTPAGSREETREIELDLDSPGLVVEVGQNIGILAPGQHAFGQKHHFRLYGVADLPVTGENGHVRLRICVRRCNYVDAYSGEEYKGVASNFLCDLRVDDTLTVTGPYGLAFETPDDLDATLILVGAGTGIAPFRAFVKHLYTNVKEFTGKVWLFHGGRSGLDLLYMNDEKDDFAQYYDRATFEAIEALSNRPHWTDEIDWASALESRREELWELLSDAKTRVYLAGLEPIREQFDRVLEEFAGSREKWARRKAEMIAGQRWVELLY